MKWSNVWLVFQRELRDQLRDRRTLFMIVVLPVLLYPLMGMAFFQISQFFQEQPTSVAVIGREELPEQPKMLEGEQFRPELFSSPERVFLLQVSDLPRPSGTTLAEWSEKLIAEGVYDAVIVFPPQFGTNLREFLERRSSQAPVTPPSPQIFYTGTKDRSKVCFERLTVVLERWRTLVVRQSLKSHDLPTATVEPFVIHDADVAEVADRRGAMWAKILPFVLVVWALTGAFYPAVDLCAGEKERGTLETLLCSPADRQEIVWGKLLTVSLFSIATSILNMISMTATGAMVLSRLQLPGGAGGVPSLGSPPIGIMVWMVLAIVPLSAMFSALSLALATMARSTKEGQYYLMPLLLVTLPLAMVTIMPTSELSLGYAIIPVTGVMMVLRTLLEGDWLLALKFSLPVIVVTGTCCLLAIRWAVHQFNDESVLFRESEQFSPRLWLRQLIRDRGVTPTVGEGFMAGILLLVLHFFANLFASTKITWTSFAISTLALQLGLVLAPVVILAIFLTASRSRTLLLRPTQTSSILAAILLAVVIQPAAISMRTLIQETYPISPQMKEQLEHVALVMQAAPKWQLVLLLAVLPAICEELAFRGFILSGLRHLGNKGMAILISSLFFGIQHGILQQSLNACLLGMFLGYIAVQTGSIFPCIVFHMVNNALNVVAAPWLSSPMVTGVPMLVVSILASGMVLRWFRSLPVVGTPEERLHDALDQQAALMARS